MLKIPTSALRELFLRATPLLDVRAPVEFMQGALPGAVNLPIMNNEERAQVGTVYKHQGRDVAIALGHKLVSGKVREERLQGWRDYIRQHPETVLYCFRGGLRSQITQSWLAECGVERPLLAGGFREARQFLRETIEAFSLQKDLWILSGPTGSGKTHLLKKARDFSAVLDLEELAKHRGSAFGSRPEAQPSQVNFENQLAVEFLQQSDVSRLIVEDESRLVGRCAIPDVFFQKMRSSALLYVEEPFEQRVQNIFTDYILQTAIGEGEEVQALAQFESYRKSLQVISRKLGGLRSQEILHDMDQAQTDFKKKPQDLEVNKVWIGKLLKYYYDPLYAHSLERRTPKILLRGSAATILDYLRKA